MDNPLDNELHSLLKMMDHFRELTYERGKRPDKLGEQIHNAYIKINKFPIKEFTPYLWDKMNTKYEELGLPYP
tara:strand:- start:213 stop:431 length:219 start_codon:yes stop_codon:yes gene_type:complete